VGGGLWGVGKGQRRGCGKRVVVVEQHRHRLGGAKVWDGALTSKVMWQLARKTKATKEFLMARGMMFEGRGRPSHPPPSPCKLSAPHGAHGPSLAVTERQVPRVLGSSPCASPK